MLSHRQAFPTANRVVPNHYLVAPDEVRTLLHKHGFNPRFAVRAPREATREEINDPNIRTYQLIKNTDAAPRDLAGIGCTFTLGRTYCFGESIPETHADKERTPGVRPWQKRHEALTTAKKESPTHRVTCEVLSGGRITVARTQDAVGLDAATQLSGQFGAIGSAATSFGWVDLPTLLPDADSLSFPTTTTDAAFWCDGASPARVLVRPL